MIICHEICQCYITRYHIGRLIWNPVDAKDESWKRIEWLSGTTLRLDLRQSAVSTCFSTCVYIIQYFLAILYFQISFRLKWQTHRCALENLAKIVAVPSTEFRVLVSSYTLAIVIVMIFVAPDWIQGNNNIEKNLFILPIYCYFFFSLSRQDILPHL